MAVWVAVMEEVVVGNPKENKIRVFCVLLREPVHSTGKMSSTALEITSYSFFLKVMLGRGWGIQISVQSLFSRIALVVGQFVSLGDFPTSTETSENNTAEMV